MFFFQLPCNRLPKDLASLFLFLTALTLLTAIYFRGVYRHTCKFHFLGVLLAVHKKKKKQIIIGFYHIEYINDYNVY